MKFKAGDYVRVENEVVYIERIVESVSGNDYVGRVMASGKTFRYPPQLLDNFGESLTHEVAVQLCR